MIPSLNFPNPLIAAIEQQLHNSVAEIVAEEADAAAKRVDERVRAAGTRIAGEVVGWTNFSMDRYEIRMTIKIPQEPPKP